MLAAHRSIVHDTATRLIRKIGHKARSEAKKPGTFNHWLDTFADEHRQEFIDRLLPAVKACELLVSGSTSSRTSSIAGEFLESLHRELDEVAGRSRAGNLPALVDGLFAEHERLGADVIADLVIRKTERYEVTL